MKKILFLSFKIKDINQFVISLKKIKKNLLHKGFTGCNMQKNMFLIINFFNILAITDVKINCKDFFISKTSRILVSLFLQPNKF